MTTSPPENYIQIESARSGITLYKPRPERIEHKEVVLHRCASCGGNMRFDAAEQDLRCEMCGKTQTTCAQCFGGMSYERATGRLHCRACGFETPFESGAVGRSAETLEFRELFLEEAAQGWGTARKEIACQSCGAEIVVAPDELTTECGWCGSPKVIQQKRPHDVMRPRFLLPFTVAQDRCMAVTREWLGNSWVLPKSLQRVAAVDLFHPIFIPYWTFDTSASADWKAEVGHERKVRRNGEWKTEIVWKWEQGNVRDQFKNVQVAGTERLQANWLDNIGRFNLNALTPYDPKFLAGSQAMAYDTNIADSWTVARHKMREKVLADCQEGPSTGRVRNFSMTLHFGDEAWRYILAPLYVATYRFNAEQYQLVINGQTGEIAGQRPIDWRKIGLAGGIPIVVAVIMLLIAFAAQIPLLGSLSVIVGFGGLVTLAVLTYIAWQVKDG